MNVNNDANDDDNLVAIVDAFGDGGDGDGDGDDDGGGDDEDDGFGLESSS